MENLLLSSVTRKGQVTLPRSVRRLLRLREGQDRVGFRVSRTGVALVAVSVKEKPLTLSRPEWKRIEKLRRQKGKSYSTLAGVKRHLERL